MKIKQFGGLIMRVHVCDVLRRHGRLSVSHKRNVCIFRCGNEPGSFYKDLSSNLIRDDDLPDLISVQEYKNSEFSKTTHINDFIDKCGGCCSVKFEFDGDVYYGSSECCESDRYNKSIGLNIAIGRLVSSLDKTSCAKILEDLKPCYR